MRENTPKKVVLLGLGVSGKSALAYFQKKGVEIVGVDKKILTCSECDLWSEEEALTKISPEDLLVKSPGIPPTHPLLIHAKKQKIKITSEIELALRELQHQKKRLFAITGSNGKTTTSLLTTHILNSLGISALCLGNVGRPLLSSIDADISTFIIELSSYQIEEIAVPALDGAVILNITPNHLDRYPTFEAYAEAKLHLQTLLKPGAPLFLQEEMAARWQEKIASGYRILPKPSFSEEMAAEFSLRARGSDKLTHNYENFRAAFAICQESGVSEENFWQGACNFVKPPHRIEFIGAWKNVRYVNDSKATSVDAVIKAVESTPESIILIAGGVDKGGAYSEWVPVFKNKVKKILLIGEAENKIAAEIGAFFDIEKVGTLENAVQRAASIASAGDAVVFSPGCSSFDQFQNFEHRGEIFKQLVLALGEKNI